MTVDAFVLASFGGPEAPGEVMPFLERVTAGRGVPRDRLELVAEHYYALGGVSPINAQNRALLAALRTELDSRGVQIPLYWGNRNSEPFFADVLRQAHADGHRHVVAITTSAYSSYSGCRQYRENLAAALTQAQVDEMTVEVCGPYFDREGFVLPFALGVLTAMDQAVADGLTAEELSVLFTTHSIPASMSLGSGPDEDRPTSLPGRYEQQHLAVAERIMAGSEVPWRLVFQSRSGPPQVPWLEPDINDALREEARAGRRRVIVVPIGFVSDHVEVVWDLDHEAQATADELDIDLVRVATPGDHPLFVAALVDLLVEAAEGTLVRPAGTCSATCCRNARGDQPVVPGVGSRE